MRARTPPAICRRLLAPMIEGGLLNERTVDAYLNRIFEEGAPIRLLEGGDVWFNRPERDSIYEHATRFSSSTMLKSLKESRNAPYRSLTLAQSLLIAFLHRKIASTYFSFEFMQSRDALSFMEYTYHRISSIRYFSRAIYLLGEYASCDPRLLMEARSHLDGITKPVSEFSWNDYFGEPRSKLQHADGDSALACLRKQRNCELESLLASWRECEHDVRSQIPAEQLLHWIDEILDRSKNPGSIPLAILGRASNACREFLSAPPIYKTLQTEIR